MLDIHPAQPFLSRLNLMAHIGRIKRAAGGGRAKMLLVGFPAESRVLQEEKARRPLNIRQAACRRSLTKCKSIPRREHTVELANELVEMMLHHSVQIHQLAVDVVQYLRARRLRAQKEQGCPAGEKLDVAAMFGK